MSNTIKYSESTEQRALNKGNWWIGTGDSNKGPTVESGYWNAINPPSGGYTVYLNKESNGPSIHSITSDENLISFTNKISGNNYTTVAECLVYYQTQDDKLCVNREIENIVTDGLVLNLDAGYAPSYPTTGTTWYDLSGFDNNGTLTNGPVYDSGSISFDGSDDFVRIPNSSELQFGLGSFTAFAWVYPSGTNNVRIINNRGTGSGGSYKGYQFKLDQNSSNWNFYDSSIDDATGNYKSCNGCGSYYPLNNWYYINMIYETQNELRFYVNGVLDGTLSVGTYGSLTNSLPTAIGAAISSNGVEGSKSQYYNGKMPVVGLYNRALSATEVLQNYNAQKHRFGL